MTCKTCKSRCAWAGQEASEHGKCLVGYTPITNGDKIRSMSDYDLADWIAEILTYHGGLYTHRDRFECDQECPLYKCCNDQPSDNIEDWLKLPADKEETE